MYCYTVIDWLGAEDIASDWLKILLSSEGGEFNEAEALSSSVAGNDVDDAKEEDNADCTQEVVADDDDDDNDKDVDGDVDGDFDGDVDGDVYDEANGGMEDAVDRELDEGVD